MLAAVIGVGCERCVDCCLYVAVLRLKGLSVLYRITQALVASRVFSVFETAFVRVAFCVFVFVCLCCFIEECLISLQYITPPLSFLSVYSGASVCTLTFVYWCSFVRLSMCGTSPCL